MRVGERGAAFVIVLVALGLLMALGSGLVLIASTEAAIAAHFRLSGEALFAADAALERVIAELSAAPDWNGWLDGSTRSPFTDGPPAGRRRLADGSSIDLVEIANQTNCHKSTACTAADLDARSTERPWGATNPRWTLVAHGRLASIAGSLPVDSPFYIAAFVADDGAENDGDAMQDGVNLGGIPNPGRGIVAVRAEAFGPRHVHRVVEARIARIDIGSVRRLAWNEVR